jgi:hypothetical protein
MGSWIGIVVLPIALTYKAQHIKNQSSLAQFQYLLEYLMEFLGLWFSLILESLSSTTDLI